MDPATPLARNLRKLRVERQWTYEDAATATGFDADVLEGLERGATFLSRTRLADLAERLGVRLDDLVS